MISDSRCADTAPLWLNRSFGMMAYMASVSERVGKFAGQTHARWTAVINRRLHGFSIPGTGES